MEVSLVNIGFGNIIAANRIIAILPFDSLPVKRIIKEAKEKGKLINATFGRRTKSVIITDSGHIILSAIQGETILNRTKDLQSS